MDQLIKSIFLSTKSIALVGASEDSSKDSNNVMKFLISKGFKVFPINPHTTNKNILGEKVYKDLNSILEKVDIVNVFRPSVETIDIAKNTANIKAKTLWLQLGIKNKEARKISEDNKINFIENKCTKIEYNKIFNSRE